MNQYPRNQWYVAAWSHEVAKDQPLGVTIIEEPLVLYRTTNGAIAVLEDRCPHRHAPLSLGRVEEGHLRCMYHGLKFDSAGRCVDVPAGGSPPAQMACRRYPAIEKSSWVWVWMGDPAKADPALIPNAWGLDDPQWSMKAGALEYDADYQLVHDNLLDLNHLDYVHETSLGGSLEVNLSAQHAPIERTNHGLRIRRWLPNARAVRGRSERCDFLTDYQFSVSGTFVMTSSSFPVGTSALAPEDLANTKPFLVRIEQQAVTPTMAGKTRYTYASGVNIEAAHPGVVDAVFEVLLPTFEEDRRMIEAQQRIWNVTLATQKRVYLPQDKAPAMLRRMIADRVAAEQSGQVQTAQDQSLPGRFNATACLTSG